MEEEKQEQFVPSIALMLNLNEVNFIIEKLAKYPYEEIAGVLDKIRFQAYQQLQEQQNQPTE